MSSKKQIHILTGATSGIGKQIFTENQNYNFILIGRDFSKIKNEIDLMKGEVKTYTCEFNNLEEVEKLGREISFYIEKHNFQLSTLINNAGMIDRSLCQDTSTSNLIQQINVNFLSAYILTKELVPILKKQQNGQIINIASTLGIRPIEETSAYSAAKAALINWTQCLALELAKDSVKVNSISPGIIETPIHDFFKTNDSELRSTLNSMQPLGKIGTPEDISSLTHYFIQNNNWITGTNITVDGGILLKS